MVGRITTSLYAKPAQLSRDSNKQAPAHTDGLLMASCKAVVIGRFEKPAEAMFARWPEHKVSRQLASYGVLHFSILLEINPFGTDAQHELRLPRYGPRFLEKEVGVPFRGIMGVEGRHACLDLQPTLDRRDLSGKVWRESRCSSAEIPACRCAKLKDGYRILVRAGLLRRAAERFRRGLPA